jgi:formylmethanofuran dehydrogenase subunit E
MVSEAEDITDKLSEYGTLDEEEIQSIKDNAERKEQKIQQMETDQGEQAQPPVAAPVQQEVPADDEDTTEIRKFVICPKCGEKIWL